MKTVDRNRVVDRLGAHICRVDRAVDSQRDIRLQKSISVLSRINEGKLAKARQIYENDADWMDDYLTPEALNYMYTPLLEKREREWKKLHKVDVNKRPKIK